MVTKEYFGNYQGLDVFKHWIENENGIKVAVLNYGGIITDFLVPDSEGNLGNVVLSYDKFEDYVGDPYYLGAIVGRNAGRIRNAQFAIDDEVYKVSANEGSKNLHGGFNGFNKVVWSVDGDLSSGNAIRLSYESKHLEEGFPGQLDVSVTYLLKENGLQIQYEAQSDRKTVVNLTNHSYFNLSGNRGMQIDDHLLKINAKSYCPLEETFLPIGVMEKLEGNPLDFSKGKAIKEAVNGNHEQVELVNGIDHPYVLEHVSGTSVELTDPVSGRYMKVLTDQHAVVVYSGNFLPKPRTGICFETQEIPDWMNQPETSFSYTEPGKPYRGFVEFLFA